MLGQPLFDYCASFDSNSGEYLIYNIMNEYLCNSQSTAKQMIHRRTYDIIPIGFINYDRILVIETAVTLLIYLNLCAYRVRCLSAT